MKQRINITIESDMLEIVREMADFNDMNISQYICNIIDQSADMICFKIDKLYKENGGKCACCGKQLDIMSRDNYPKMIAAKIRPNGDKVDQIVCEDCYNKKMDKLTNNLVEAYNDLLDKNAFLESLKQSKIETERRIDVEYDEELKIDMIYFNGWLKNICDDIKRGIVPFSDICAGYEEKYNGTPVIYDDSCEVESDVEGVYYKLVCDAILACDHHDIMSYMDELFEDVKFLAYIPNDDDDPHVVIRFGEADYEYIVENDGDWYMA